MAVKKQVEKKSKVQVEENDSESESEIEYHYNDDDDDDDDSSMEDNDSDDPETEDSENEELATTTTKWTHKRKKVKNPKLERLYSSGSSDDDDDANDASSEGDSEEGDDMTDEPRKKKIKISKVEAATDSEDDTGSEESEDGDNSESEKEEEEGGEEEEEEEEEEESKAHRGFANVLSNILSKKTSSSKKVILAQGKTDREIKKLKESKLPEEEKDLKEPPLTTQELEERKLMRKLWLEKGKVKPNPLEKNHERELKMIATRGVVQLFNAVKRQQKMVNENLSGVSSERKKDMVIESMNKKSFINLLQNTKVDVSLGPTEKETPKAKEPERKIWSVLQDDFVIGTGKMKDWDKQENLDDI